MSVEPASPSLAKVHAVIRAQQVDAVIERLLMIGVRGLTIVPRAAPATPPRARESSAACRTRRRSPRR